MTSVYVNLVIDGYAQIIEMALPVTLFIGACNIAFNMIFSAFMGGQMHMGGK